MKRVLPLLLAAACSGPATQKPGPTGPTPETPPDAGATGAVDKPAKQSDDPFLWLEDVTGDKALAWAKAQNAITTKELEAQPGFEDGRARLASIMDSKDKIPYVGKRGKYLYNLWKDADHLRGLYRRTSLAEYRKKDPKWETVLDVDALGKAENESWVFEGMDCLYPKYEKCLVALSRGGSDATVWREFDMTKKDFVADGFSLPEGKSTLGWKDDDTVFVSADFGAGTMSPSGYPLATKEWKRGTKLDDAPIVFQGDANDVGAGAYRSWDHGKVRDMAYREITTFTAQTFLLGKDGYQKLDVPDDASIGFWDDQAIVSLRTDWTVGGTTYAGGSTLIIGEKDFLAGKRAFQAIFTPTAHSALDSTAFLKTTFLTNELVDVHNQLFSWKRTKKGWVKKAVKTPKLASFSAWAYDEDEGDDYWFSSSDFLTPSTLELQQAKKKSREVIKKSPTFFDAKGLSIEQHFATSADGTKVPYFQIGPAKLPLDGSTPTLIEGYGGFEISLTPYYSGGVGSEWLEKGGVYVVPNLRGGGEYGPMWHQQAILHNRQRVYEDFAAVAQDLIDRKVTAPAKLGIRGGSNGGLLVGVMMTERPDLFGAVVCQAPLLDMKRYHLLLAGASWMGEYGNPDDPDDWAAISQYSPYQNVKKDVTYPRVLFTTSTRDDRVHPGHARKMAAKMEEQGHDVLFYENVEGGHAGAADSAEAAYMSMLTYSFLYEQLGMNQ
jgi:prolyl oligopeptidase